MPKLVTVTRCGSRAAGSSPEISATLRTIWSLPMPREKASERQKSGLRLRKLRDLLGFTQREMAGELAVTHGAIAGWESGKNPMPGPVQKLVSMYEAELG